MFGGKLESCLHFRKNYKRFMQKTVHLHFPISPLVFSMSNPFRPRNCMSQLAASSGLKRNKKTMDFFFLSSGLSSSSFSNQLLVAVTFLLYAPYCILFLPHVRSRHLGREVIEGKQLHQELKRGTKLAGLESCAR